MSSGDRVNDKGRPGDSVSSGKDPRSRRSQSVGVDSYGGLLRDPDARALGNKGQASPLAHGENDVIAGYKVVRAGNRYWAAAPCFVG